MGSIHFHIMVPVYKVEKYLDACVQSVLDQNYSDFTLYLVDDGSPDNSGAMCDAWAEKDKRIRAFHKPNGKQLQTRCFAIERAKENGVTDRDYAVFLDSDDWLNPGALKTIARKIDEYGCECLVYGAERVLDGKVLERVPPTLAEHDVVIRDKRTLYDAVCRDNHFNAMWSKAVRLDRLGTWDFSPWYHITIGEDAIHSLEIYQNCQIFCFIPDVLYSYRLNPDSVTETSTLKYIAVDYEFYDLERRFLEKEPVYAGGPMAVYRSVQIHTFTGNLVNIARLPLPRAEKKAMYDKIRQTPYWREFLDGGGYDRRELGKMAVLYEAFRHRWYGFILALTALYWKSWRRD